MKECFYITLGVSQDSSQDEIKKAYRLLALRWHPDKNTNNIEEATRIFRNIQEAYEVLSDERERAFYDRNKASILRDDDDDDDENYEDFERGLGSTVDVMPFFRASCFQGYSDDNVKSFYSVYRNLFQTILENEGASDELYDQIDFGTSQTAYSPRISDFYSYFSAFTSNLSFARADKWDLREAPNRRIRRLMEKENSKARESAKREYSDRIRELTAFVKKRDPRIAEYQAQVAAKQEEQKRILKEQQIQQKRQILEAAANYVEQDWEKVLVQDNTEIGDAHSNDQNSSFNDDDNVYLFECVACNKNFKSEKQFHNHEKSKKHLAIVKKLKRQFQREDDIMMFSETIPIDKLEDLSLNSPKRKAKSVEDFNDLDKVDKADEVEDLDDLNEVKDLDDINDSNNLNDLNDTNDLNDLNEVVIDDKKTENYNSRKKSRKKKGQTMPGVIDDEVFVTVTGDTLNPKTKKSKKSSLDKEEKGQQQYKCVVCKGCFSSRNKLFDHLKATGHSVPSKNNK